MGSLVQFSHSVRLFVTPWTAAHQASLFITKSWSLLKLMSIKLLMPTVLFSVVLLCSCFQSFPASGSFPVCHFFASGGQSIGASVSASVFSNEYSGLVSFRMNSLDLFVVQAPLKSLSQHCSSNVSLFCSAFFIVQLSHHT